MPSSSNASSSDDGIFTEHVDLNHTTAQRKATRRTAAASPVSATPVNSSPATDTCSPTGGEGTLLASKSRVASSTAPSLTTANDGYSPSTNAATNTSAAISPRANTTTTAGLSVAALQAMSGSAMPPTQRSASTNTEISSDSNDPSMEGHRRRRSRRRVVGGARPPLHKNTLHAAAAAVNTATDGDVMLSGIPTVSTPSPTSEVGGARDTPELPRRRLTLRSVSTGDLVTASSLKYASYEVHAASVVHPNSPIANASSLRRHHSKGHAPTIGSASAAGNSPHSPGPAAPVAAHLLSDEAYLDTFKIPALIAQLSLSLMAAKPVDLRAFTRDWLADRLVSEEDEAENQADASADADYANSLSAATTGAALSPEQGSTRSYGMGASSSMSDAVSNQSSHRNKNSATSTTASLQPSTHGGGGGGAAQRGRSRTRTRSASKGARRAYEVHEGGAGDAGEDKEYNSKEKLEDSPSESLATTSGQPTLLEAMTKAQKEAECKNSLCHKHDSGDKPREQQRRKKSEPGSGSTTHRSVKHKPLRHGTKEMKSPEGSNPLSGASSPAATPSKATQSAVAGPGSPHSSSPNTSIMKTMSPQETSTMTGDEKKERAHMLADVAEAAFLHEASESKEKAEKKEEKPKEREESPGTNSPAASTNNAATAAAAAPAASAHTFSDSSSSSSSSSNSFFDSPANKGTGWARVDITSPGTTSAPSSAASNKGGDANRHEPPAQPKLREKDRAVSCFHLPLPVNDMKNPNKADATIANMSSLTKGNEGGDSDSANHDEVTNTRKTETLASPVNQQATSNPLISTAAMSAKAKASGASAPSISATPSPEPDVTEATKADVEKGESVEARTPHSSKFQTPPSTTSAHSANDSGGGSSKTEHLARGTTAKDGEGSGEKQKEQPKKSSSSSSSDGDDNASFAMFAPLLAVDRHTNEVIDYRTTGGCTSSPTSYPGAPPLNIPTSGVTRIATPPSQGAPLSGYLVNSLSVGNNTSGASAGNTPSVTGGSGSHLLQQTHVSAMVGPPPPFPPYAPRSNTGAFNLLPTPMLADMVGGGGLTNSSFGRRGVQNTSFGRRTGASSVTVGPLTRQTEHVMAPSTASLTPPPFLTPHESGNIGMTNNWKSVPNLQLAGFAKTGGNVYGANPMSCTNVPNTGSGALGSNFGVNTYNSSGGGGGGFSSSLPQTAAGSLAPSRAPSPRTTDLRADVLTPADVPTSYCQSALMQGKAGEKQETNEHSDADTTSLSRLDTVASSCGGGAGGHAAAAAAGTTTNSPLSTTLKVDAARRLGKLMDQLPVSKYAAAIVFLEGLMNSDGVEASGSDAMSTTTTIGAASSRGFGRLAMADPMLAEPGSASMGRSGKPISPDGNPDVTSHPWPMPRRNESSPLGSLPIHGVSSFSERLGKHASMGGGKGFGLAEAGQTREEIDLTKKSATASSTVEALVRDALSQSVLRTLPQTHSAVDVPATASSAGRAHSQPSHAVTTSAVSVKGGDAVEAGKNHTPLKTVHLSSVRLDDAGDSEDRRLFAAITSATTGASVAVGTTEANASTSPLHRGGTTSNVNVNNNNSNNNNASPASVMGGASGRSAAFPSTTPSQLPISNGGGGASSFYKPPSGNDLSSLCRNTSAEEPTSGSPMEQSSPLTRRAATDAVRTTGQASEPRHTDLQAVSTAFASALTSVDKLRAAVTEKLTTVPLSPSGMKEMGGPSSQKAKEQDIATVWASAITTATRAPAEGPVKCPAEQSLSDAPCTRHVDPAEDQMGGPLKPEENGGDADKEGTTDLGETTRDNTHEALTKEIEVSPNVPQPAKVEELPSADELQAAPAPSPPVVEKGMSEAERKSESPVHNPLSLLEDKKEAAKDKDNKRPPLRSSSNRSSGSGSGSGSSAPRHRKAAAEGSATLPANAEAPNSKPDQPPLDDDESQELTMRQGHRFFSSAVQTFSHDDQAAFDNTAAANSLLSRTRGDTGGGSSSSASASHGAGSTLHVPQLRRRRSTAEMSRDKDSAGSWLEILGQSGDTSSRNSRHRGNWNTTPSLPHECPPLDSPHGTTSTGTGFTSSPPPPPLPDSVMLDEKGGMWRREGMGQRGTSAVSPKPFDEDIDLGATLRTAVVMAAAAGSSIPHHDKGAAAFSSPSGTYATQSSSQLPESSASIPFSPRKPPEENRLDLATSPSSFGLASPQSPGFVSMPTTAPTRPPRHQEPSSVVSSSIVPPTRTHNNSAAAEAVPSLSVVATQGEESSTPVTTVVSPTTQPSPSLSHKPRRELAVTSSVAVAMNSFLSREDRVSPEEVEVVREAVTHFDAFAALDETQVETLVRTMARVELQQGQTLVHEGDPTLEKLLLVVSGKLSVIRKGVVTRSFTKGQFYGEMEMSYHIERSRVMVTAVVPTVVYALTKVDYQKLVMHEKDARRYMFLQYVNQCDLFKGLSPPTKMRLADSFRVCRLRKGSKLTEQGAPVQWMYLLMSGSVRMTCKPPTSGDTPNMGPADGVGYDSPLHKAVTADSDVSAAAAATAANAVIELMNPTTNLGDTAMLASLSSTTHGPNSSYRFATTTASPPFTPFHSPSTLTQTPEGKPGTGVPELLQLAEANVYSAEMRKNSGSVSVSASPFHTLVTQQQQQQQTVPSGPQARLNSGSREENNSNSANCHTRLISTSDAFEDASPSTPPLHKAASSSPSEDHRSVATKDTDTPQRNRKRRHTVQQQQSHYDPYTVNLSGSRRVGFPATSPTSASFGSTSGSLDLAALQRCTSPSPSTTSATAKRSILSMNAAGGSGSSRRAKAASGVSADSSAKPQDALVVVDRSRGKLVGESEFVFKCKGLFTAVATTSVQAARISRLHFEAIMSRSVVEELKRNMLLNPDYYYFESTVPEELKQEMRRMLFRLNVNSSPKNRSHLALPPARRRSSYRGGSGEKSVSCIGAAMGGSIAGESNNNRSTNRHGWSRQLSCSTSLMMASQLLQRHAPRNSAVLPSSPTAKSTPKRRFRMVKVRCDTTGGGSNAEEELSSVRSANGAKPSGSPQQQRRLHRSAPLEPSPAPDSERREAASISTAGNIDPSVNGNNANGQSTLFLTATSVSSNRLVPGSSSSTGDLSPINMPMEEGSNHGGGGGGGGAGAMGKSTSGMNASVTAGRSRTGPRRNTADNLTLSAKRSSTTGSQSRRISARGEIVFSGSRNLYRFTADAMSLNEGIVIAVVVDGTIIRWNAVAQSVTGFAPFETIGKSIYDFITSEEGRQQMRDVLGLGAHYAGKWEQYVEQHLQENRLFPFRQNTGLYHVGLALSVVPSNFAKTAEVLLLVGREGKYRAANTYASEVARWLEGSLKPQLRQFQRRMMQIESHGWHVTSEDALQVKGNLDACLSMVEQFTKFSLLNMETVNESWRPVRLPVLLSRFAIEAATFARQRHHEYYCNVELVEPKTDIFLDAPQMLAILRLLLTDAFMSPNEDENGSPIVVHAELRVTVVEPHDTHPGPGGVISSPARMTTGNLGTASPTSFGAPSTANAGAVGGAKTKPAPLFGVTSSGLPSHQSNAALVMLADQLSLLPHGAPTTDPLPRVGSFQQAPSLHPTSTLASREEDAGQVTAADGEPSATGADDATSPGGGGGDTPIKSTGNTEAAGMCASLNGANTARGTMSTTASNPPTGRAATTGAVSIRGAGSPNTTVPASLSSSLRRIRFELRDDGPTILSLRSPEAVATESMRAARSPTLNLSAGSAGQSTPGTASLPMEGFPSAASSVALDGSRRTSSAPPASTYVRGAVLHQVEKIVSNLGGTVYGFTRPEAAGNVVRVELPLLAVPGANEDGREEESGMTTGGGSPFAGGSRTFTVIVADNNRAHQQQMCQILWARQHAVVPVTSFRDLVRKLEMNTADILLIDPLQIDISSDDYESLLRDDPFDEICILSGRLALVVMTSDFSDWRVQKLLNRHAVVELPKVGSGALVHIAMQEAEQLVTEMRDEEERIDLIRRTFTNCSAERHKIGKRIGKGAFGDVFEVEDTLTGGKMAMKRMRLHDGLLADEVVQEILAMTTLKHENIIQYFYCEKESDTLLRLYMELAPGGTLRDKIREHPGVSLPFEDIVHHLSDICHGLAYVHEQRYVHGDLKTANLLLGTRGRTKIGDFGTAKHLASHQLLYTMVGTPQYMAPEVLTADVEERLGYDFKADIWSLGCIVLEMATGNAPFAHLECAQGMGIIKYLTELTDTPDLSPLFSGNPLVYEFVKSCLEINPQDRPTAQELLHFDILEGAVASQRAERLVKRAEMLYKLNKYAAMRADGGGGGSLIGDGHGSNDSGHGDGHDAGQSEMLYTDEDSNATEEYDYYDEEDDGELSEGGSNTFDGADNVSPSNEEEEEEVEEGEYIDEEYEFSSSGSDSKGSDTYKQERHAAELKGEMNDPNSPAEQRQSKTTQSWQSPQEHVSILIDLMKTQLLAPHEQPVQNTVSPQPKDAHDAQTATSPSQLQQQQTPQTPQTPQEQEAQKEEVQLKPEAAAPPAEEKEEEGREKAQENEDK